MNNNIVVDKIKEIVRKDILKVPVAFFGISIDLPIPEIGKDYSYCYTFDGEEFLKFNDEDLKNLSIPYAPTGMVDKDYIENMNIVNEAKYVLQHIVNTKSLQDLIEDIKENIDIIGEFFTEDNGYIESIYITFKENKLDYILLHCAHEDLRIKEENKK